MAGNSKRKGAVRGEATKKGKLVGSGGQRRRGLTGKGPTPKAEHRPGHPAARRAARKTRSRSESGGRREADPGRNAVDEAVAAGVPAIELAVGEFLTDDPRSYPGQTAAQAAGIPVNIRTKSEMDQLGDGLPHQGIALVVAPFEYVELHDVIAAHVAGQQPLVVALDHVQDSRNLGAIARTAAAFGASGLILPNRRAASVTASAWRSSAARRPASSRWPGWSTCRGPTSLRKAGYLVVGPATKGGTALSEVDRELWDQPVAVVVGNEAVGISALVAQQCDLLVTIPIASSTESLNASVATAIALDRIRNPTDRQPSPRTGNSGSAPSTPMSDAGVGTMGTPAP